jgi:hypothetical protein
MKQTFYRNEILGEICAAHKYKRLESWYIYMCAFPQHKILQLPSVLERPDICLFFYCSFALQFD